jgi:ParB-like chromosome segregation protein Spo0J
MAESVSSRPEDGEPLRIWEVPRLWELARDLPVKKVPLSSLTDLERVGWHGQERHWGRLTCREVADHARRIYEADLDQPILLSAEGHLLDGFHRLAKAYLLGVAEISAVQFPENPEPDRVRPLPEWLSKTL